MRENVRGEEKECRVLDDIDQVQSYEGHKERKKKQTADRQTD